MAFAWSCLVVSVLATAALIAWPLLRRALWLTRVPLGFGLAACIALAGPEQTRYLVAGIDDWTQGAALLATVALTGIGGWFWARWSLNLAWQAGLPGTRELRNSVWWPTVPRALSVAPAIAMGICLWLARDLFLWWRALLLAVLLAVVAAGLVWLAFARRGRIERRRGLRRERRSRMLGWFLADEELPERPVPIARSAAGWVDLALRCLPFRAWVLLPLLLLFALAVAGTLGGHAWPSEVAQAVGAAPTALFGMAAILTLLAPLIGLPAVACRWPALLFLVLLVLGAAGANVNTLVRREAAPPSTQTLRQAAEAWLQARAGCTTGDVLRAVIVANAGGASRAALWTAAVLRALELDATGPRIVPSRDLFAVSGISGGALGAAAYVADLSADGPCAGPDEAAAMRRLDALQTGLGRDFLAPALQGLFFGDAFWRLAGPLSALATAAGLVPPDRTQRLERAWEAAFAPGVMAAAITRPGVPLLVTGGTHQESGALALTMPVRPDGAVPQAIDVLQVLGADVRYAVAASNSARFPYVTAPGLLRNAAREPYGQLVDGGYFDNQGTVAAIAAATALEEAHRRLQDMPGYGVRRLHLFVVQVLSDPDLTPAELPRCGTEPVPIRPQQTAPTPLDFLASPIGALVAVRGERANAGAAELQKRFCGTGEEAGIRRHFALFALGIGARRVAAPLSWVLPANVQRDIAAPGLSGFEDPPAPMGNPQALGRLGREWADAAREAQP